MIRDYMEKYKQIEKQIGDEFRLEENELKLNIEMRRIKEERKLVDYLKPDSRMIYDVNAKQMQEISRSIQFIIDASKNRNLGDIIDKINDEGIDMIDSKLNEFSNKNKS